MDLEGVDSRDSVTFRTPALEDFTSCSPARSNLEEMVEAHYFNKTFHFIEDLSMAEVFQRGTLIEEWSEEIVAKAISHHRNNPLKFFEDTMGFLRSNIPTIFVRFNVMLLIVRLCAEVLQCENHPFSRCCELFEENMIEITNLIVGVDSGDPPLKLPNPNVHAIKRVFMDANKRRIFTEDTINCCMNRLEILSNLPQSSNFMSSYESLRSSRIRNMVKDRINSDREKLRKSREEYQLSWPCDNWDKDSPELSMAEFELAWKNINSPLTHKDTCTSHCKIHIFKG